MALVDLSKPGEKKKLIFAGALGLGAILVLYWALIGFDSRPTPTTRPTASASPSRSTTTATQRTAPAAQVSQQVVDAAKFAPIVYEPSSYSRPEAKRNIFAYYEPPKPAPVVQTTPIPTPPPPPPILLASVSPSNVYARTADFKLEAAGDKFTSEMRIFVDGREMPTAYKSPQQLSTTMPASMISAAGARQLVVRTPAQSLFSNQLTVNVAAPPTPNFAYTGNIGTQNRINDTALVQDRSNKNVVKAMRGD